MIASYQTNNNKLMKANIMVPYNISLILPNLRESINNIANIIAGNSDAEAQKIVLNPSEAELNKNGIMIKHALDIKAYVIKINYNEIVILLFSLLNNSIKA